MEQIFLQILFVLEVLIFLSVVFLQMARESKTVVLVYLCQSLAVVAMLAIFSFQEHSWGLLASAAVMLGIKAVVAPIFFFRLIESQKIKFSTSTYLNTPMMLLAIMFIVMLVNSSVFMPLVSLAYENQQIVFIALSGILSSLFLIINRRGALSQIIGILSLENSIVSFASVIGLKQTLALELGIIFDIFVWIVIATVFMSMMYKYFGSLNITEIKNLKD